MFPGRQVDGLTMVRAEGFYPSIEFPLKGRTERNRVDGFTTNGAPHKFHDCYFFPFPF
jgi:hypothetical protein